MQYKEALEELKNIILRIENEEIGIDDIEENLKRAKELLEFCREKLRKTETLIDEIIEKE